MIDIKFKAKKRKVGNSFVVTIPFGIAQALDPDKEYFFKIGDIDNDFI